MKSKLFYQTNKDIKPCPFCGSTDVKYAVAPLNNTVMFVCMNTKCGADVCFFGSEHEPKASKAWNTRAGENE